MMHKSDSGPIRILYLEDSVRDHELIRNLLENAGLPCTLTRVSDESAFLDALLRDEYDIILSDYRMPGYDGVSAMESALQLRPDLPFIIVSGSIGEEAAIDLIKRGASDYVLKENPHRLPYVIKKELKAKKEELARIAAEHNLRESEAKFRNLFINHSAVKFIIDPDDGRILEANRAAAAFYGWSIEEMQRMHIHQINTSPREEIRNALKLATGGENLRFEFRHRKADGSIADVEVVSSLVDIGDKPVLHSIVQDISRRKRAEEQLRLLHRAVEQISVAIVITDPEGSIHYVNPGFTEMTGYPADEVLGQNPRLLQSGYHSNEFYADLWSTILSGKTWEGEMHNRRKDGAAYWEKAVISPVLDSNGDITHFVSVKEDVTRERRLREELIAAKNSAEESDRLKTAFLMNMSHEIRTPMNGILGFMSLLTEPDLEDKLRREYVDIINVSGGRLIETLDNIIEISRIEAGGLSVCEDEVDTEQLLRFLCEFFHPQAASAGNNITLVEHVQGEEARVYSDEHKLHAILSNLLKNAVKFTEKGRIEFG
ncbi:MAG: PAS domain S-box protein, partial [Bacteroidota bacterium]|nr:PAS domain S-box protein [Bacteroidota bacterium]